MVKFKATFSQQIPLIHSKGSEFRPDLLLAFKGGKSRVACLDGGADLSQVIYQMECFLDLLKDMRWAETLRKAKATHKKK